MGRVASGFQIWGCLANSRGVQWTYFLKTGGEVGRIAEAAAFRDLSHVESWIEKHALCKLHALTDEVFLKRHSGGAAVDAAEMTRGQMEFVRNLLDGYTCGTAAFDQPGDGTDQFAFALAKGRCDLLREILREATERFADAERAGGVQYLADDLFLVVDTARSSVPTLIISSARCSMAQVRKARKGCSCSAEPLAGMARARNSRTAALIFSPCWIALITGCSDWTGLASAEAAATSKKETDSLAPSSAEIAS